MSRTLINVSGQTHNPTAGQAPKKEGSSAAARNGQTSKLPTGPAAGIKAKRSAPIMKRLKKKIAFWNTGSVNAGGTVCTDSRQCCGDKIVFTDVASTAYYTESVPWAVEIRIVSGTRRQLLLLMQPAGWEIQRV